MELNLAPPYRQDFNYEPSLPVGYTGPVLVGSDPLTAAHPALGRIIQQQLSNTFYTIRLHVFELLQPFQVNVYQNSARLVSLLALKNNLQYTIEGLPALELNQSHFALLHSAGRPAIAEFSVVQPYVFMEIAWNDGWLRPLLSKFDFLKPLFAPAAARESFYLPAGPKAAGIMALDTINTILTTPFDADLSRLLFESQVREYMLLLLIIAGENPKRKSLLTERERSILFTIIQKVKTTFHRQFRIDDLSREAGMNATKFKDGFKELSGSPMGRLQLWSRMEEGKRLLIETELSTKQITNKVGYKRTTSFVSNFKRMYGYNPSEYRKGHR